MHVGHAADQLGDADTVVVSTAVREDNPEYAAALARGLRVLPRSAALASVMAGRQVVAVAGTHGKTTTTALLTGALVAAGADPTYAIGADLAATGSNAAEGTGDLFVAEADESDGAFLHYAPYAAIVTNIEADHLDHWGTEEAYARGLRRLRRHRRPGRVPGLLRGRRRCRGAGGAAASARPARGDRVDAARRRQTSDRRRWPGSRSGRPATTTSPTRCWRSPPGAPSATPTPSWPAASRRSPGPGGGWSARARPAGVRVYDSYAHHPTEIAGDLASARELAGDGRLLVAFQPHLVSRTRTFGTAMGEALGAADEVVVCDVYLAREDADPSVTGALVASAVPLPPEHVAFVPDLDDVPAALVARARPGDLVLTLGAGSVTEVGPRVLELLGGDRA